MRLQLFNDYEGRLLALLRGKQVNTSIAGEIFGALERVGVVNHLGNSKWGWPYPLFTVVFS